MGLWNNHGYEALGRTYRGFAVTPSTKKYFYDYQYKITFQGNNVHYDIQMYSDLIKQLQSVGWWYRIQSSAKNINVYVNSKDYLDRVIDWFQHTDVITGIHGPINKEHIATLLDANTEYVYRNKYWYNKYSIKITLRRPWGLRVEDSDILGKEFKEFVQGSFDEYRLFDDYTYNWYSNYLWLTQEQYDKGYPFLKLSYGDLIDKIQTIKLTEI